MASRKVFSEVTHPTYGVGFSLWEKRSFFERHYPKYICYVVDYVCKEDGESYLTIFIPKVGCTRRFTEDWRNAMQVDWLKRAAAAKTVAAGKDTEVTADGFAEKFPALFTFMAATTVEGKPRELCKLQVFADSGAWKAALHDPNTEHSVFVTLGSPLDACKALEKALTAENVDWRSWGRSGKKKR